MRFGFPIAALFTLACQPAAKGVSVDLIIEPSVLTFAGTPVGDTRAATLHLLNGSRAPLRLVVESDAPFSADGELLLSGGAASDLVVRFSPSVTGEATGVLRLLGGAIVDVPLSGHTIDAAVCVSEEPCRASRRDTTTNTCIEEILADGTACSSSDACLTGTCVAGDCVGSRHRATTRTRARPTSVSRAEAAATSSACARCRPTAATSVCATL